ncbi:MAG: HAD-IA family hydrolase [Deltaproteobacteria bacterium]|nr:HAD-IA family hydrolase [Deltaproteobacteria bacterium]
MKYWVFDFDGTIVNSFPHYFDALETIFFHYAYPFPKEKLRLGLDKPAFDFLCDYLDPQNAKDALKLLIQQSLLDTQRIKPFDGIEVLLQHLTAAGSRLGIWTNRDLKSTEMILENTGLTKFFEVRISGNCVTKHKPDPEGLQKICNIFCCLPNEITVVGDHSMDVSGAKTFGATAVRASWHGYWEIERCSIADWQFYSVATFYQWIQQQTACLLSPTHHTGLLSKLTHI